MPTFRIFLTGAVAVVAPSGEAVFETDFPSRQARRAFACLVCTRLHGVTSEQLAAAVWPGDPPPAWRAGIAAIVSKLRQLGATRLAGAVAIRSDFGVYRLDLPIDSWVDFEAAAVEAERATAAVRNRDADTAWASAMVAASIAGRPFLQGEEGAWIEAYRGQLHSVRVQALACLREVHMQSGLPGEAARWAEELVKLEPYSDQAYVKLMQAHLAAGNPSQAIAVFHRMRELFAEELGIDPSPEAEAHYLDLLRRPQASAALPSGTQK